MSISAPTPDLADYVAGRISLPATESYDSARTAWNLAVDQQPIMVVEVSSAQDIVETIRYARTAGLRVAAQGTGHNAAALGDVTDTVLLRTHRMRAVTVDSSRGIVRAESGALWDDVIAALEPHGLMGLIGSSGSVGIAGYLLGGGCSWFGREYGLACNAVTALEVVTGDGELCRVDADIDPDLFWAMRGGGGNAAIVTAIEFRAFKASKVYGGALLFPIDRAAEIFAAYRDWAVDAPREAGTSVRLLRLPPLPDLPEQLRGQAFVGVDGVINLPAAAAERLIAPLRARRPVIDTFSQMPASAVGQIHMDPPGPVPGRGDGMILDDLSDDVVSMLLASAGPDADCPLLAVDLRHIAGALGESVPGGGAVDHFPGQFMLYAVGVAPVPGAAAVVADCLSRLTGALQPYAADYDYLNFRESPTPASRFYPSSVLTKLREIRRRYDPDNVVRAGHEWAS